MARDWAYSKYISKYKEVYDVLNTKVDGKISEVDEKLLNDLKIRYLKMDEIYNKKIAHFIDVQIDIWKPVIEQEKK